MLGQVDCSVVLLLRSLFLPPLVIDVLTAAGGVGPDSLDVAVGGRTDPHLLPRRRNGKALDPGEYLGVFDGFALGVDVAEAAAPATAAQSRPVDRASTQPHTARPIPRVIAVRTSARVYPVAAFA